MTTDKNYVCGFLFKTVEYFYAGIARQQVQVALIRKLRPSFQLGKLNGVGGAIEMLGMERLHESADFPIGSVPVMETPYEAMRREFREETGHDVQESNWAEFCVFRDIRGYDVHFFKSFAKTDVQLQSMTDEIVQWVPVYEVLQEKQRIMRNLKWLLPMALDPYNPIAKVQETVDATRQDTGSN